MLSLSLSRSLSTYNFIWACYQMASIYQIRFRNRVRCLLRVLKDIPVGCICIRVRDKRRNILRDATCDVIDDPSATMWMMVSLMLMPIEELLSEHVDSDHSSIDARMCVAAPWNGNLVIHPVYGRVQMWRRHLNRILWRTSGMRVWLWQTKNEKDIQW
jgi:hypothetical protein